MFAVIKYRILCLTGLFTVLVLPEMHMSGTLFAQHGITYLGTRVKIGTFLGNHQRNYYGNKAPEKLNVLWKTCLGEGITYISPTGDPEKWAGAGWTGQPLLVEEDRTPYLIQGAYDHYLKKIDASNGRLIWEYPFDDVVKAAGTLFFNRSAARSEDQWIILQGSRLGTGNRVIEGKVPSYRAISYHTGKELWRLDVRRTDSYSRDVDASALIIGDTAYIGLENGVFMIFDPNPDSAKLHEGLLQPKIIEEHLLYHPEDKIHHGGNLVTEASPALLGNRVYLASGSGHVFGYTLDERYIDWDFRTGSDMDGCPVITSDRCILVSLEKQYIEGKGGVMKLDPSKDPEETVVWYYPVGDSVFSSWEGGVVGSVGITDHNKTSVVKEELAAFAGIDGYLYVVKHKTIDPRKRAYGPNKRNVYPMPELVLKYKAGPSISTPAFVRDKLIVAGYHGLYLFQFDLNYRFKLLDSYPSAFESTPIAIDGKIYIASRNGYLYCFGE